MISFLPPLLGKIFTAANAPALITAGGSLAGGLIDNKERRKDAYANSPQGIREAAEAAGFNPLAVLGLAGNFGAGYAPTMGAKIANGIAAAMDQNQYADQLGIQKARLEMENRELNARLEESKFNAGTGGVYGSETYANGNPKRDVDGDRISADDITGSDLATDRIDGPSGPTDYNPNVAPKATFAGVDWYGSGAISSGQAFEDAIGEFDILGFNPITPFIVADAVGFTAGNQYSQRKADKTYSFRSGGELYAMEPYSPKPPTYDPGQARNDPNFIQFMKENYATPFD